MTTIKRFLKQSCSWEKRSPKPDAFGNWTYDPPITLRCRKTTKAKQVNNQKERTYVDVSVYWTEEEISIGDRLDGEEIMARKNIVGFAGEVVYWESNPRPPLGFTP